MTKPSISTATADEIISALSAENRGKTEKRCQWCGKGFIPARKWQIFCCGKCRDSFHSGSRDKLIEELQATLAQQERVILELRTELAKTTRSLSPD